MPRIAIVGSCITRDLWPIRGGGSEHLLYVSRTALPSLLAPPVAGFTPSADPPGGLHRAEHSAMVADLQKTALGRLIDFQPTHVIFDFIDERYDLLRVGDSIVTEGLELLRSGYLTQPAFDGCARLPRLSTACERLWLQAAGEFAALVRATPLARAQLILHEALWATAQRGADGTLSQVRDVELLTGRPVDIRPYNRLLTGQQAAFLALMPPMAVVRAPALRLADADHRWGLSPFHYVAEYYAEIRRQLATLGVPFSASVAQSASGPSVPAA